MDWRFCRAANAAKRLQKINQSGNIDFPAFSFSETVVTHSGTCRALHEAETKPTTVRKGNEK